MNNGVKYLEKLEEKINNMSNEEFLENFYNLDSEWHKKYDWNMNDERFINKLDEIIDKVHLENDCQVGHYTVGSDEDNEDFDYLESLEYYLEDYTKSYSIPINFFEDDVLAIASIPFKYKNKVYVITHGQGQGSFVGLNYIEEPNKIKEQDKIVDLMNMEGR